MSPPTMTLLRARALSIALCGACFTLTAACAPPSSGGRTTPSHAFKRMLDRKVWLTANLNDDVAGSYCYDDDTLQCHRYGRLYTWSSARQACTALRGAWRLPTDSEWTPAGDGDTAVWLASPRTVGGRRTPRSEPAATPVSTPSSVAAAHPIRARTTVARRTDSTGPRRNMGPPAPSSSTSPRASWRSPVKVKLGSRGRFPCGASEIPD